MKGVFGWVLLGQLDIGICCPIFLSVVLLCSCCIDVTEGPTLRCKIYEEYVWKDPNSGRISCIPCHSCPAGQEVKPRCDLELKTSPIISRCGDCKAEHYKSLPGTVRCKPCSKCVKHQIMERQCTRFQNRVCKKDTCEAGYYYTNDLRCDQCCPCLGDSLDIVEDSCSLIRGKPCRTRSHDGECHIPTAPTPPIKRVSMDGLPGPTESLEPDSVVGVATPAKSSQGNITFGLITPTEALNRVSAVGLTTQVELSERVSTPRTATQTDIHERVSTVGLTSPTKLPESVNASGFTNNTARTNPENESRKLTEGDMAIIVLGTLLAFVLVICICMCRSRSNLNPGQPLNEVLSTNGNDETNKNNEILNEGDSGHYSDEANEPLVSRAVMNNQIRNSQDIASEAATLLGQSADEGKADAAHGGNNYRMEDLLNDNMSRGKEWVNSSPKSICERVKLPEKWSNNEENAEESNDTHHLNNDNPGKKCYKRAVSWPGPSADRKQGCRCGESAVLNEMKTSNQKPYKIKVDDIDAEPAPLPSFSADKEISEAVRSKGCNGTLVLENKCGGTPPSKSVSKPEIDLRRLSSNETNITVEDGHQEKRNIEGFDSATRDQDTAEMQPFYPPAEVKDGHQEKRNTEGFDSATREQDTTEIRPFCSQAERTSERGIFNDNRTLNITYNFNYKLQPGARIVGQLENTPSSEGTFYVPDSPTLSPEEVRNTRSPCNCGEDCKDVLLHDAINGGLSVFLEQYLTAEDCRKIIRWLVENVTPVLSKVPNAEELFAYLDASIPDLRLAAFLYACKKIGKNDVIGIICKKVHHPNRSES